MAILAVSIFVVAYVLIASDKINKTLVALVGAGIVLALGIVDADGAFYNHETGIDWNVIFLLFGMMIIVGVLRQTGVFEYVAIWAAKRAGGSTDTSRDHVYTDWAALDRFVDGFVKATAPPAERAREVAS